MYFYTPILAMLATAFFQAGGRRALRKGLEASGRLPARKPSGAQPVLVGGETTTTGGGVPSLKIVPPSPGRPGMGMGMEGERESGDLRWVKHAMRDPGAGKGMGPDAGFVDGFVLGAETPRSSTPKPR